jgi:hypothetical protein
MPRTAENPFQPRLEGVPLALTIDGKSLGGQDADPEERDFLLELAATPLVDALALDASPELEVQGWRRYLADPDLQRDSRPIAQTGAPGHFFGGVQPWSARERRADELGLTGGRREWFLYYEAVTWYHRNSGRHFFVTADRRLLRELNAAESAGNWRDRRIVSISQALRFVGLLMVSRNTLYLEARNGYTRTADPYNLYFELAYALAPSRVRLHSWLKDAPSDLPLAELEELEQSVYGRVMDLLRARDSAALVAFRTQQNWATVDETLYHLRYAVLTASALVDSIAVFSQRALRIDPNDVGGVAGVSLDAPEVPKTLTYGESQPPCGHGRAVG